MSFTGKTKASTYKDILQMNNSNSGVDGGLRSIVDGDGTESAIKLSTQRAVIQGGSDTATKFAVQDADSNNILLVDTTNDLVKAGTTQTTVNTQIQQFTLNSNGGYPTTTNWTAIQPIGNSRYFSEFDGGTGSTPSTTVTVDGSTNLASELVQIIWYVPFNISIDSCNVWFGADANSGDVVQFSVMSYTIDSSNGSTGGDLSSGVENCVSPSTITGAGDEQAYYQALTVSTADVDAGKVLVAWVKQDGTNSDLMVNMQLIYHIR